MLANRIQWRRISKKSFRFSRHIILLFVQCVPSGMGRYVTRLHKQLPQHRHPTAVAVWGEVQALIGRWVSRRRKKVYWFKFYADICYCFSIETRSSSVGSLGRTKSASQSSNTRPKTATGDNSSSDRFRASSNPKLGSGSGMNSNGGKNKSGSTGVKKAVAAMYTTFYPPDTLAGVGIESLVKVLGILEDDFRKLKTWVFFLVWGKFKI